MIYKKNVRPKLKIGQEARIKFSNTRSHRGTIIGLIIQYTVKQDDSMVFSYDQDNLEGIQNESTRTP